MENPQQLDSMDHENSNSLRTALLSWEETDKEQAVAIWTRFVGMVSNAASLMCTMVDHAINQPTKIASLLVLNGCNYLETSQLPSSHECLEALFLMLFDFLESMIYKVCQELVDEKLKQIKKGYPGFCRLSWIFHCHMLYAGNRYPNLRKPFLLHMSLKEKRAENTPAPTAASNLLQLIPTLPGMLVSCVRVMPFENPRTFLRCFGANKFGIFLCKDELTGVREIPFPSIKSIVAILDLCEKHLISKSDERANGSDIQVLITTKDATAISNEIAGIHACYWYLDSSNLCSVAGYKKIGKSLEEEWDAHLADPGKRPGLTIMKLYHEMKFVKGKKEQKACKQMEYGTDFLDKLTSRAERVNAIADWFADHHLPPKRRKVEMTRKTCIESHFANNLRMRAIALATRSMVDFWNEDGRPIDVQLGSIPNEICESPRHTAHAKLSVSLHELGKGDAPCVVYFENAFSARFIKKDRETTNVTPYCEDTKSDGGSSSIASFFHCKHCLELRTDVTSANLLGPLMRVGAHNSVSSSLASTWEKWKMELASKITNSILDLANDMLVEAWNIWNKEKAGESLHSAEKFVNITGRTLTKAARQSLDYLGNVQNFLVDDDFKPFPRQAINCNISKVGNKAKYGRHQDSSSILNSDSTYPVPCKANCGLLPTREDMLVLTMVTGIGACQARVTWERRGNKLLTLETSNNCIHLQLAGVQGNGIYHASDLINKREAMLTKGMKEESCLVARKIDTYRMTLCPACDKDMYRWRIKGDNLDSRRRIVSPAWNDYSRRQVMGLIRQVPITASINLQDDYVEMQADVITDSTYVDPLLPLKRFANPNSGELTELLNVDRFQGDPPRKIRPLVLLPRTHALHGRLRHTIIRHYEFVRAAFERGLYFDVVTEEGEQASNQPVFLEERNGGKDRLLLPGDVFRYHELPVDHNRNSTSVILKEQDNICVFVHAYKNDPRTFLKWYSMISKLKDSDVTQEDHFQSFQIVYDSMGELLVNGFASSQVTADIVSPTAQTLLFMGATYTSGFSQTTNNEQNSIFNKMREEGRVSAVFMCPHSWGDKRITIKEGWSVRNSQDEVPTDELLFLGYCYISKVVGRANLSVEEVQARFAGMSDYAEKQCQNLSHMYEDFYQYTFRPVFSANQIRKSVKMRKLDDHLIPLTVGEWDTTPLVVSESDAFPFVPEYRRAVNHSHISSKVIRTCICSTSIFDSLFQPDGSTYGTKENEDTGKSSSTTMRNYVNSITINQVIAIVVHAQACVAMRFKRRNLIVKDDDLTKLMVGPLLGEDTDLLPDSLRLCAIPAPNADFDVVGQFAFHQMLHLQRERVGGSLAKGVKLEDNSKHQLWECLFMATINRLTGNVAVLSQYNSRSVEGLHLPTPADGPHFVDFLRKVQSQMGIARIFSKQHQMMIPKEIRTNHHRLEEFIGNLSCSSHGFVRLKKHLIVTSCSVGECISGEELESRLINCLDSCGDFQGDQERLGFLAGKIIMDVEGFLSGTISYGEKHIPHLGWGSKNGLDCISLKRDDGSAFKATTRAEKFATFHTHLVDYYTSEENPREYAISSGWKLNSGRLQSLWGGRPFTKADSEHILCKVWLCVMRSHACRNISRAPRLFSDHCYPLPVVQPWESTLDPIMDTTLKAFSAMAGEGSLPPYPEVLLFPHERR